MLGLRGRRDRPVTTRVGKIELLPDNRHNRNPAATSRDLVQQADLEHVPTLPPDVPGPLHLRDAPITGRLAVIDHLWHGMLSGNSANDTLLSYKIFATSYMLADRIEIV